MTETELQNYEVPRIESLDDLKKFIMEMVQNGQSYDTAPYAVALASYATFKYMALRLGISGFQASWADMQFIKRTRKMKDGFRIINYSELLYPQYEYKFNLNMDKLIEENIEHLKPRAIELLEENKNDDGSYSAHEDVVKHWKRIAEWE